jgi:hypothetical protein
VRLWANVLQVVKTARWLEMDGLERVAIRNATFADDDE